MDMAFCVGIRYCRQKGYLCFHGADSPLRLRTGDLVEGTARSQRDSDKFAALLTVDRLNGHEPEENPDRLSFDQLVPVYPNRRIVLESEQDHEDMAIRLVGPDCSHRIWTARDDRRAAGQRTAADASGHLSCHQAQ